MEICSWSEESQLASKRWHAQHPKDPALDRAESSALPLHRVANLRRSPLAAAAVRSTARPRRAPLGTGATLAVAILALPTCAATVYQPPRPDEPHAAVELRLAYQTWSGAALEQRLSIDGNEVRELPAPAPRAGAVATRTLRVRPGASAWSIQVAFFHDNVTTHAEPYETVENAPCGASDCPQIKPHTRLVNHVERVDDAGCAQGLRLLARAGEKYVLEFTYAADRQCTLACHREGHGHRVLTKEPCSSPGSGGR
jgi:hypothetical protein